MPAYNSSAPHRYWIPACARLALPFALVVASAGSVLCAATAPDWRQLTIPQREGHSLVYDATRGRTIAFGGFDGTRYLQDVWVLDSTSTPQWTPLEVGLGPSGRSGHGAVYDAVGDRMIVFGGRNNLVLTDAWALNFGGTPTWTPLLPNGSTSARTGFSVMLDPIGHRAIMFGGRNAIGGSLSNQVQSLSLSDSLPAWSTWTIPGGAPVAREGHSATYDPVRHRMLVFGGESGPGAYRDDSWALSLDSPAWQDISPAGTRPPARTQHMATYGAQNDELLIFGGGSPGVLNGPWVWVLPLSGAPSHWTEVVYFDGCPPVRPRVRAASCFDTARGRWVMFGGVTDRGGPSDDTGFMKQSGERVDYYFIPGSMRPLAYSAAVFDGAQDRVIVQGGMGEFFGSSGTWSLRGSSFAEAEDLPEGPPFGGQSMVYDSRRNRLITFDGLMGTGFCSFFTYHYLFAMNLSDPPLWVDPSPTGTPPSARWNHTAIYDPVGDRMIVFGGDENPYAPNPKNDTWALEFTGGAHWVLLMPAGVPPSPRSGHEAVYDPAGHRMLVFGGEVFGGSVTNDVWSLDLAGGGTWSQLVPIDVPPETRADHSMVLDTRRQRLLVFGGRTATSTTASAWALSLTPPMQWTQVVPTSQSPPARFGHAAAYDSTFDRMVVFGGRNVEGRYLGDVWSLWFNESLDTPPPTDVFPRIALSAATPNPARDGTSFVLDLPRREQVVADIHDLAGRRVRRIVDGELTPGRHTLHWDGADEFGSQPGAGVYFCKVRAGGIALSRRAVIVR